ncbi:hypothetical protein D9Q98_001149 [Chlorella vulgaris]|uniref:Uncharacterized protein n=1 Tax=Chlorella vulgaris TaxID=3077 RepID=A0A9D4Z2C9_CHLVU|nr:hypothetical protein D9Q98_001149 [Chlorella vulgaris]
MELYQAAGSNVAVVQQRAAAAPGTQDAFGQSFAAFLKQSGVKEVFVLGSIEAGIRRDSQLVGLQLRCWAPESDANAGALQSCKGSAPGGVPRLEADFWQDRALPQRQLPPWPLLRALQQQGVPCAALLSFTTEADNLGDAFQLASAAAAAAGLQAGGGSSGAAAQPQWQAPSSWQYLGGGAAGAVY